MSLRARLLVGVAVVAAVLVGAAVLIARTTESDLVARVDDQLQSVREPLRRGPLGRDADDAFSSLFVGVVQGDTLQTFATPNVTGDDPRPRIPMERVATVAQDGQPRAFTVGTDSDVRFRVLAQPTQRGAVVVL